MFAAEVKNSIAVNDPYGDGTDPDREAGDLIALAEGWATLTEFLVYRWINRNNNAANWVAGSLDGFQMNSRPMTLQRSDFNHWFLHGLFWDCVDGVEPSNSQYVDGRTGNRIGNIVDNVQIADSREVYPIFRYLTSSTWDACDFGNKLANGYPSRGQAIEALFASYGYHCVNAPPAPTPPSPTPPGPSPPSDPVPIRYKDCGGMIACP